MAAENSPASDKFFERVLDLYEQALTAFSENKKLFNDAIDFYSGEHWPAEVRNRRETGETRRPCLTFDRLQVHCKHIVNGIRQRPPQIKVVPEGLGADPEAANAFAGIVRSVELRSNAPRAYSAAMDTAVPAGLGYLRVILDSQRQPKITWVPDPMRVLFDPYAEDPTGRDAGYVFISTDIPRKEFERRWPEAGASDWGELGEWITLDSVRVAEFMELKDGKVKWYLLTAHKILEEDTWPGTCIPVVRMIGERIIVSGKYRYIGLVHRAKDAQFLYDISRSNEAELLALAPKTPFVGAAGQFEGFEKEWQRANEESYSYLEYNPISVDGVVVPRPERERGPTPITGYIAFSAACAEDIRAVTGQFQPSLGQPSNEKSGIAIQARALEGESATFHFIDNAADAIQRVGEILVEMIPSIYMQQGFARSVGMDGKMDQLILDPQQEVSYVKRDLPQMGGQVEKYNLGVGSYSVHVSVGSAAGTTREEARDFLNTLVQQNPALFGVIGDLLLKVTDVPMADQLAERIKRTIDPKILGPEADEDPEQVAMQQMAAAKEQLDQIDQLLKARAEAVSEKEKRINLQGEVLQNTEQQMQEMMSRTVQAMAEQLSDGFGAKAQTALEDLLARVADTKLDISMPQRKRSVHIRRRPDGSYIGDVLEEGSPAKRQFSINRNEDSSFSVQE